MPFMVGECAACPSGTMQEHRLILSFLPLNQPICSPALGFSFWARLKVLIYLSIRRPARIRATLNNHASFEEIRNLLEKVHLYRVGLMHQRRIANQPK